MKACFIIVCLIMLTACSATRDIPVESVRTEYVDRVRESRDSIYLHDSVFVLMKGDTLFVDRWHNRYTERRVHDTTYINRSDTIRIAVPVEVEKNLTLWQRLKVEFGGYAILGLLVICFVLYRIRK